MITGRSHAAVMQGVLHILCGSAEVWREIAE